MSTWGAAIWTFTSQKEKIIFLSYYELDCNAVPLGLYLQNVTMSDEFSASSTSSADLSGLVVEPKLAERSHSLALSSDEVCGHHFL